MMMVTAALESDAALAALVTQGDQAAFASLYERYFDRIYDFVVRILRDADLAAEVVQGAFVSAWESLRKRDPPQHFKAWLYAIARNAALREVDRRKRLLPEFQETDGVEGSRFDAIADSGADPQTQAQHREVATLVWAAAAGLSPRDYSLLDMHLRQDLQPEEIATALDATRGNVYTMLSRLRDALEESVTAELLRRRGVDACQQLQQLTSGATELTPALRRKIQQHLRSCDVCQETKRRQVAPAAIFAAIGTLALLPGLQDALWSDIALRINGGGPTQAAADPAATNGADANGSLAGLPRSALTTRVVAATLALGAVAAFAVGLWLAFDGGGATAAARDPTDVRSTTHVIGQASDNNRVLVVWTPVDQAQGYAVLWSQESDELPPPDANFPGAAAGTASEPLPAGDWYFHLRTRGPKGDWTSTVHLGPFVIEIAPTVAATSDGYDQAQGGIADIPDDGVTPADSGHATAGESPPDEEPPSDPEESDPPTPPGEPSPHPPAGSAEPSDDGSVEPLSDLDNGPPIAADDFAQTSEDTPVTIDVLANDDVFANDTDVGNPPTLDLVAGPANGSAVVEVGEIRYTPNPDFFGSDELRYRIGDAEAIVSIDVIPVNDPPLAADDAYAVELGDTLDLTAAAGVLANDFDVDGDPLSLATVDGAPAGVMLGDDGSLRFEPPDVGVFVFSYAVEDGSGGSDTAVVTMTVSGGSPQISAVACSPSPVTIGSQVDCTVQLTGVAVDYAWTATGGAPAAGSAASFGTIFDAVGTKTIDLRACNGAGCDDAATTVVVIPHLPTLTLQSDLLTLSASSGFATLTATLIGGDGAPVVGASVTFTTTLGDFQNQRSHVGAAPSAQLALTVATDAAGLATVQLFGDGTLGLATITAQVGAAPFAQLALTFTQ